MPAYLERYLDGEHEQVWDELLALGATVREEPLYPDAFAVARETMRRTRYNVETIVARLRTSGYKFFAADERVYIPPQLDVSEQVSRLEQLTGAMPLTIRVWYEMVGAVDLSGSHPRWRISGYIISLHNKWFRPEIYKKYQLELNKRAFESEPLQVKSLARQFESYQEERPSLYISDDVATRSGFSGGGIDEIATPEPRIDGVVIHDYGFYPSETFVQYLRRSFAWGGFPGFANVEESLRPTRMLAELTEGLLPI